MQATRSISTKLRYTSAYCARATLILVSYALLSANLYALEASLSSKTIALNKAVVLTINSFEKANLRQLDLSALENDFHISNPDISSVYQIINGNRSSKQSLSVTLKPKKTGRLQIPSFRLDNRASKPILLTVTPAIAAPDQLYDGVVIAKAKTNKRQVTVGESFVYTLQLYHLVDQESGYTELNIDNAESEPLSTKTYTANLQGKTYYVQEQRFVVKPLSAGKLTIESPTLKGQLYQNGRGIFRSRGVPFEIAAKALEIDVRALPSDVPSSTIVAEALDISESTIDGNDLKVGQPITRRIKILAKGSKAEHLPDIKVPESDSFSVYEEPSQFHNEEWLGGYAGTRIETFAIVPTEPGPLKLPAIAIEWWNTQSQQLEKATLPAVTLDVAAGLNSQQTGSLNNLAASSTTKADLPNNSSENGIQNRPAQIDDLAAQSDASAKLLRFWKTTALLLLGVSIGLCALVLSLVLRSKRTATEVDQAISAENSLSLDEQSDKLYKNAISACKSGDILAAKQIVSQYLNLRKSSYMHPDLAKQLASLDQRLYASAKPDLSEWDGSELAQSLLLDAQSISEAATPLDTFSQLYPSPK